MDNPPNHRSERNTGREHTNHAGFEKTGVNEEGLVTTSDEVEARAAYIDSINKLTGRRFGSTEEMVEAVLQLLVDQLGMRSSHLSHIVPEEDRYEIVASHNTVGGSDIPSDAQIELYKMYCNEIARMSFPEPLIVEDTKSDPRFASHPAPVTFPNIGSYLGVPVTMSDGSLYGTLCAVDPEPHHIPHYRTSLSLAVARIIATAIEKDREIEERRGTEEQLHHQLHFTKAVTDSISSGLFALDPEGRVTFLNPAAERMLGWTQSELLGKKMEEVAYGVHLPEDTRPAAARSLLSRVVGSTEPVRIDDDTFVRRDGKGFSAAYSSAPLMDGAEVAGSVVSFQDISERKRAEEARWWLAAIVESSEDAIIGKTPAGIVTNWNRGAQRLYGYSTEEVVGRHINFLSPSDYRDEVSEILKKISQGEKVGSYETVRATKDGRHIDVAMTTSPIKDTSGKVIGASVIARDITERKRSEAELVRALDAQRKANEKLERVNKIRSDFVSVVSHEFRTALTGIQGFSQMMRDENLSAEEMKEFASDINEDAKRLNRMITEMLDLDRMESGRMTLNLDRIDINTLVQEVVRATRLNAPGHSVRSHLDEAISQFLGDRDKLTQVVSNLLNNAVKYSPEGGVISVHTQGKGETATVQVQDEGVGIPPEAVERLFEPYSRAETENTRYIKGTGLGLAISREIVRLHGGKIWAESTVGQGSTFYVTLPLRKSEPTA